MVKLKRTYLPKGIAVNKTNVKESKWMKISPIALLLSFAVYLSVIPYGSSINPDRNIVTLISGFSFIVSIVASILCLIAIFKLKKWKRLQAIIYFTLVLFILLISGMSFFVSRIGIY